MLHEPEHLDAELIRNSDPAYLYRKTISNQTPKSDEKQDKEKGGR